jgi:hypothetical protein
MSTHSVMVRMTGIERRCTDARLSRRGLVVISDKVFIVHP